MHHDSAQAKGLCFYASGGKRNLVVLYHEQALDSLPETEHRFSNCNSPNHQQLPPIGQSEPVRECPPPNLKTLNRQSQDPASIEQPSRVRSDTYLVELQQGQTNPSRARSRQNETSAHGCAKLCED